MKAYRVVDTRTGGEIQIGGTVTDHCGHLAKLISVSDGCRMGSPVNMTQ